MELWVWVSVISCTISAITSQKSGFGKETAIPSGRRTHYQYIDHDGANTYKYGYDTGSDGPAQFFHHEEKGRDGKIRGRYGHIDQSGLLRIVEYLADETGYHVVARPYALTLDGPRKPVVTANAPFVGPLPPFIYRPLTSRS